LIDIADVGTAVDLFVAVTAGLELQVRTSEPIEYRVGDRCQLTFSPDAIAFWPVTPDGPLASSANVSTP